MNPMFENFVTVIHLLTCITLILVIILQSGKGGGVSAAFGGGAGAALGQRGAATVLGKFTAVAAAIFMVTSMALAVFSTPAARDRTLDDVPAVQQKKIEKPSDSQPATAGDTTAPAAGDSAPATGTPAKQEAAPTEVDDAPEGAAPAGENQ